MELIIPAFIAGILMFLAPCTLPLLPAYLGFIGGFEEKDLHDKIRYKKIRRKVFLNGLMYVLGFSLVFVLFGSLAGLIGAQVLGQYRALFTRIGGIFVIIFGLFMLDIIRLDFLQGDKKFNMPPFFKRGKASSSFLLGVSFAFGWTPCIGPILASILLLASSSTTVGQGAFLLGVFSLGLAIPFLLVAWGVGSAYKNVQAMQKWMPLISKIGGVFLIVLGFLLFTNNLGLLIAYGWEWFGAYGYEGLLDYY